MLLKPILRVESNEVAYQATHGYFNLPDTNIQVCSVGEVMQLQQNGILPPNTLIQMGDTWIKSPYDDKYISIRDYEFVVTKDKINHIAEIVRNLGAEKIDIEVGFEQEEERTIDSSGEINYKVINGEGGYKKVDASEIINRYKLNDDNLQCPFDIDTYQYALAYANVHCLYHDSDIASLFQFRNLPNNRVSSGNRRIDIVMSNDLNQNLEIAAKLQVLPDIFKLDATFKKITKTKKNFKMTFNCIFPPYVSPTISLATSNDGRLH